MKSWETLLYDTAETFGGQLPRPETATAVQTAHQRAPQAVERAIQQVANEYEQGTIRSPWGVLRSRVANLHTPQTDRQAKSTNDDLKAIERAEQWIRNAGLMYDRQTEIEDELFGDRGMLRDHDTPATRTRLLTLWTELAPTGAQIEADADERGQRHQAQRAALNTTTPKQDVQAKIKAEIEARIQASETAA